MITYSSFIRNRSCNASSVVAFGEHFNVARLLSACIGDIVKGTIGGSGHALMSLKMNYALRLSLSSL